MKKTDIGVVVFMYLVCGFFYYHMTKLKASSQTYPRFTIILLFGLTTLYLVQMIVAARKYGVESGVETVFCVPVRDHSVSCRNLSFRVLYSHGDFYGGCAALSEGSTALCRHSRGSDCCADLLRFPEVPGCEAACRHTDQGTEKLREG